MTARALPAHDLAVRSGLVIAVALAACGTDPSPEQPLPPDVVAGCQPPVDTWNPADGVFADDILAIAALTDGAVLAGTASGVFALDQTTGLWESLADLGRPVTALASDPADPRRVLALADGIHESTDGGASWEEIMPGPSGGAIAFAPSDPTRVYAALGWSVFVSEDGGRVWMHAGGLPPQNGPCERLIVAPGDPRILVSGQLRSTDGGSTWVQHAWPPGIEDVTTIGNAMYATQVGDLIFESVDDGQTWTEMPDQSWMWIHDLVGDPRTGTLYAVADNRLVLASTDGARTWQIWLDQPIGTPRATTVGLDGALYVAPGSGNGVITVSDGGTEAHWYDVGISGYGRRLAPQVDGFLYVLSSRGVYVSGHAGINWASLGSPFGDQVALDAMTLLTAPSDPAVLYLTAPYPEPTGPADAWVLRSDDGGGTWLASQGAAFQPSLVDPVDPDSLYTISDRRLRVSRRSGAYLWGAADVEDGRATGVFADHGNPSTVLLASDSDEGTRLTRLASGISTVAVLFDSALDLAEHDRPGAIDEVVTTPAGDVLLASTGLLMRHRAEASWSIVTPEIDVDAPLIRLTPHPTNGDAVLAIADGRLYRSDDLGLSWCAQDDGFSGLIDLVVLPGVPPVVIANNGAELRRIAISP